MSVDLFRGLGYEQRLPRGFRTQLGRESLLNRTRIEKTFVLTITQEGQGSGEKIGPKGGEEEEVKFDALGNPIAAVKKEKKKSAAEIRKAKKDRMARRKRGEEVFTDEEL